MAETLRRTSLPFDVPTAPKDDGTFTISKLKATSESLRCFNDALARIGETQADEPPGQPAYRISASPGAAKVPG